MVTVEGTLEQCRILKPLPYMDHDVFKALATYRYTPAMLDGRPVSVERVINLQLRAPAQPAEAEPGAQ